MSGMIAAHKGPSSLEYEEEVYDEEDVLIEEEYVEDGEEFEIEEYVDEGEMEDGYYVEEEEDVEEEDDDMSYEEEIIEEVEDDEDGEFYEEVEYVDEEDVYDEVYEEYDPNESTLQGSQNLKSSGVVLNHEQLRQQDNQSFDLIPEQPIAPILQQQQQQQQPQSSKPTQGPNLFDAIKGAATARNERLEDGSTIIMKEYQPEVEKSDRPMNTADFTALVSKAAKDREARLEAGGEKKVTEIKSKSEYRKDFNDVALEAAMLGRLTRLNEFVVESVAVEKTPEEEWRSKGLLAIQFRTQHIAVIHEAARAGAASKLREKVISNFSEEEEDMFDEWGEYDETKASTKRVSHRMKQLLQLSTEVGTGQRKIDELIAGRKEEKMNQAADKMVIRPMVYYLQDIKDVKLPRRKTPKIDPTKELEKIKTKFRGTYQMDRPLSNISSEVAERAWARRTRLDRPGSMPRVQEVCNCPYCVDPSPVQTQAYKELDKDRKEAGYESPDSEEERKKAREKRRVERRQQRMKGAATDDAPGTKKAAAGGPATPSSGSQNISRPWSKPSLSAPTLSASSSYDSNPPDSPKERHRLTRHEEPVSSSIVSAELASMIESAAPKPRAVVPRLRTTNGKIGAAARRLLSAGTTRTDAADANSQQTNESARVANDTPTEPEPTKTKVRKVVRRRRKVGDAGTALDRTAATTQDSTQPTKTVKTKRSKGMTTVTTQIQGPKTATTKGAEREGRVVRKVKVKSKEAATPPAADGSMVREQIITKPDGSRVIRKVTTTGSPGKVITKRVVRSVGGTKKVTTSTIVDNSSAAPRKVTTTITTSAPTPVVVQQHSSTGNLPLMTETRRVPNRHVSTDSLPVLTTSTISASTPLRGLKRHGSGRRVFLNTPAAAAAPPPATATTTITTTTTPSPPSVATTPRTSSASPEPRLKRQGSGRRLFGLSRDAPSATVASHPTSTATTAASTVPDPAPAITSAPGSGGRLVSTTVTHVPPPAPTTTTTGTAKGAPTGTPATSVTVTREGAGRSRIVTTTTTTTTTTRKAPSKNRSFFMIGRK